VNNSDRFAPYPNAARALIEVAAPYPDHDEYGFWLVCPSFLTTPPTTAGSLSRATFWGSVCRKDAQKVGRAFVERLTDAVCYTAKGIKSSLERLSGNSYARVNLLTISRVIAA
jgi:hypothetical protein